MSPSKAAPPKIAIKGFSLSSKPSTKSSSTSKTQLSTTLGKRPRSTFASHDSESEDEGGHRHGKHEAVIEFGERGAVKTDAKPVKAPLIIERLGNSWKVGGMGLGDGRVEKKNLLPPEVIAAREAQRVEKEGGGGKAGAGEGVEKVNGGEGEIKWGLSVRARPEPESPAEGEGNGQTKMEMDKDGVKEDKAENEEQHKPQTADEEAIAALAGRAPAKNGSDMVIRAEPLSEEEAYRRSIASAPDPSTLEEYALVPVEEFGAALLRGMGWNGEEKGKVRDVQRRQNLLGLGAKKLVDAEELGAWVGKARGGAATGGGGGGRGGFNGSSGRGGERRPKVSEYRREKELKDQRREERGGSYRREKEREREGGYRDRERERERDRDGYRERDRRR